MSVAQPPLSPRQSQILSLLKEGKANKEIARQLGIGVGTVKQHVIALFRKLHASNRTMAVGRNLEGPLSLALPVLAERPGSVLQWRPACVLSLTVAVGEAGPGQNARGLLQSALAAATRRVECTLVSGMGSAEVIFGLHHADERSQKVALGVAAAVRQELRRAAQAERLPAPDLRGGLASGYLLASMERKGGWTGEIIAGGVIGQARAMRNQASPGMLMLDFESRRQFAFTLGHNADDVPPCLPFDHAATVRRRPARPSPVFGRDTEMAAILGPLALLEGGRGGVVVVEGEAGMGKTALCRALGEQAIARGVHWIEWRCGDEPGRLLRAVERTGGRPPREECHSLAPRIYAAIERAASQGPQAILVDDVHLATAAAAGLIRALAELAGRLPVLLVLAARLSRSPALAGIEGTRVRLGRLEGEATEAVVRFHAGGIASQELVRECAALSAGVPLFAARLATRQGTRIPLALAAVVLSRLDLLPLDRGLLALVARHGPMSQAGLAGQWDGEPEGLEAEIEEAVRLGVLVRQQGEEEERIAFAHPLVGELWREITPETENS